MSGDWKGYYVIRMTGEPQDFKQALALVHGNEDAEWYIERMTEVLQGKPDPDDGIDRQSDPSGNLLWIAEDHHGVGDGGAQWISNTEWIARDFPQAFKLLGVTVSWSNRGKGVFFGSPDGTV